MPHPEGYRKAMRVMELAERFGLPVVTFVDVPGAHPGPESEERGIAEAIARSIGLMSRLRTPIVTVITGEGGSGGALAIAVGDVVIALENAVYSVIRPRAARRSCGGPPTRRQTAAVAMRMTAADQPRSASSTSSCPSPARAPTPTRPRPRGGSRRSSSTGWPRSTRSASTSSSTAATVATGRSGPTLRRETPEIDAPAGRGLGDRLRDLLDPGRRAVGAAVPSWSRDEPPAREEV